MAVKLIIGGACEDIVLPCRRDTFYADASNCDYYFRCQGYQVWRNKCPPGTMSMRRGAAPCSGRTWQCDRLNPRRRCAKRDDDEDAPDGCTARFNLPCGNTTRFIDPTTCGHYLTCQSRSQGPVLGRGRCDIAARCHLLPGSPYCESPSRPRCTSPGITTVGEPGVGDEDTAVTTGGGGAVKVDNTALIVGLVMAGIITLLIAVFLLVIFHKKKQNKKKPPRLPTLSVGDPIPQTGTCASVRYSQVNRPVSTFTCSEPNHYSDICEYPVRSTNGEDKHEFFTDTSGLYEDIEGCRGGLNGIANVSPDTDAEEKPIRPPRGVVTSPTVVPRRPTRVLNSRPWSESFEIPSRKPVDRNSTRPFSLTSLSVPRPPIEPPRDSCANLDLGYAHPYFALRDSHSPDTPGSPVSPENRDLGHRYFVLEKGAANRPVEADTVSLATTYCEIPDSHFNQKTHGFSNPFSVV